MRGLKGGVSVLENKVNTAGLSLNKNKCSADKSQVEQFPQNNTCILLSLNIVANSRWAVRILVVILANHLMSNPG